MLPPAPARLTAAHYMERLSAVQATLRKSDIAALVINAGESLRYLTGLPWSATERLVALVVPANGPPWLICPQFELGSLAESIVLSVTPRGWEEDACPFGLAMEGLTGRTVIALDQDMPLRSVHRFQTTRPDLTFQPDPGILDGVRARKSPIEIALIQHAMAITLQVQLDVWEQLHPGQRASDIIRFIDSRHRALGADGGSWFCAVQFGHATAFPHGIPGDQVLQKDDLVLVDTGCLIDGYHSDITRTYAFGTPDAAQERIWNIEKEAQLAAFEAARPGAPCEAIDAAARRVLQHHGLGPGHTLPGLPHRTGHGIGLSIHEAPYLVRGNTTPLATGHCASIEPMIVMPGAFGVRLEDHIHITDDGPRWFTPPANSMTRPFG